MTLETIADFGIPLLVALLSYSCVRWSKAGVKKSDSLRRDEPLINQL